MAAQNEDSGAFAAHLRSNENSPSLTDTETLTDGSVGDIEQDEELFKSQMRLTWATTEIDDLKKKLDETNKRATEAEARADRAEKAAKSDDDKTILTLQRQLRVAETSNADLEAKLERSCATVSARDAKIEQLADKYDTLQVKYFGILENCKKMQKELSDARENDRSTVLVARNLKLESEKVELRTRLENLRSDWER
jgi:chromosome segregation ATPase